MWEAAVVMYLKVANCHLAGETKEIHESWARSVFNPGKTETLPLL